MESYEVMADKNPDSLTGKVSNILLTILHWPGFSGFILNRLTTYPRGPVFVLRGDCSYYLSLDMNRLGYKPLTEIN